MFFRPKGLSAIRMDMNKTPLSAMKIGARNSAKDMERIQAAHDLMCDLGAMCKGEKEAEAESAEHTEMADKAADKSVTLPAKEEESSARDDKGAHLELNFTYIKTLKLSQEEQFLRDVVAAKSVGKDDIRGYLALWGDPNTVDVENEFFTAKTDFWDKTLSLPRPLTWDHAQDAQTKAAPVIGSIVEMGDDDIGRWYQAQLDRSYKYRQAIDALISKRAVGTSSDSAPQYVQRERTKSGSVWLKQWPLFAAALTATPCEPRMLDAGSLYWKSIGFDPTALARTGNEPDGSRIEELTRRLELLKSFDSVR